MINNPLIKAVFVMGVPYMGVGWLAMIYNQNELFMYLP